MTENKFSQSPSGTGLVEPPPIYPKNEQPGAEMEAIGTGKTIEEIRNGETTIGDLRDAIIEAAVEYASELDQVPQGLKQSVDAYHAALREAHKEGR